MNTKKKPIVKKSNTLTLKSNKVKKSVSKKQVKKKTTKPKAKPKAKGPIIIKPVFNEKPIQHIQYSWDIENIEVSESNTIIKIFYIYTGTSKNYKVGKSASCSGLIETKHDPTNKVETSDYKNLKRQDLISYIQSFVSLRQVQQMKNIIVNELSDSKKIIKPF
tara:strand:+ start:1467 stop:1955 length:489 start_codon:yes stop_codon:yes gene_type:complete